MSEQPASNAASDVDLPRIEGVSIERELGRGGMGVVYSGRQMFVDRKVAVKVLRLDRAQGKRIDRVKFMRRFMREAKMLAQLDHPHIVSCYQAGMNASGAPFIVMELVEGPNVRQWLDQHGPASVEDALHIVWQVATALRYALKKGVLHRDIKPENVLLRPLAEHDDAQPLPFRALVVDLGLARPLDRSTEPSNLTAENAFIGTPATMAPEQALDPQSIDFRTDLYGLGCVLYHLLTGKAAYGDQESASVILVKKARGQIPPVSRPPDTIPQDVVDLVLQLLSADKESRPESYDAFLSQVETLLERHGERPVQLAASTSGRIAAMANNRSAERRGWLWVALVATLVLSVGGMGLGWWYRNKTTSDPIVSIDVEAEAASVKQIATYLLSHRLPDGGFAGYETTTMDPWSSGESLRSLLLVDDGRDKAFLADIVSSIGSLALVEDGRFAGFPFVVDDNVGFVESTSDIGLALALAKGRLDIDFKPTAELVLAWLLQGQNADGSWASFPVIGQAGAMTGPSVYALYTLMPLSLALGKADYAFPAIERGCEFLCRIYDRNEGFFNANPRRTYGNQRSVPGLNEKAILCLLEARRLATRLGRTSSPRVDETIAHFATHFAMKKRDIDEFGVHRVQGQPHPKLLPAKYHTTFATYRWMAYGWRLLAAQALAGDATLPSRDRWIAESNRTRALMPETIKAFVDGESWSLADLLYCMALVHQSADSEHPGLVVELIK